MSLFFIENECIEIDQKQSTKLQERPRHHTPSIRYNRYSKRYILPRTSISYKWRLLHEVNCVVAKKQATSLKAHFKMNIPGWNQLLGSIYTLHREAIYDAILSEASAFLAVNNQYHWFVVFGGINLPHSPRSASRVGNKALSNNYLVSLVRLLNVNICVFSTLETYNVCEKIK